MKLKKCLIYLAVMTTIICMIGCSKKESTLKVVTTETEEKPDYEEYYFHMTQETHKIEKKEKKGSYDLTTINEETLNTISDMLENASNYNGCTITAKGTYYSDESVIAEDPLHYVAIEIPAEYVNVEHEHDESCTEESGEIIVITFPIILDEENNELSYPEIGTEITVTGQYLPVEEMVNGEPVITYKIVFKNW